MNGVDRQQMFAALILVVIALFVSAGAPFATPWRRQLRIAAVVVFLAGLVAALADILWWLLGRDW